MIALEQQRLLPQDALRYCGIVVGVIITALATVSGGMPLLLIVFALSLAIRVYCRPQDVMVAGPAFLLAANVFLPSSARFGADAPHPTEIVYWAAGSLLIVIAAFLRVGVKPLWGTPRSLKAFVLATIAASIYGLFRGNDPSYVLRQWYGCLLLVAYFALASSCTSEEDFTTKLKSYSVPCVLGFVVYYCAVFQAYGVHREMTTLGTQTIILAILFAARGAGWRSTAALMVLPSLLLIVRRDLAALALGITIIAALRAKTRLYKLVLWPLAVAIVTASLVPTYVDTILTSATNASTVDELLPQGGRDSASIADRATQLIAAELVVLHSPLLGVGMGGELEFSTVHSGDMSGAYVDNGWAYVLTKMGLIGFLVFAWFVIDLLRWIPGNSLGLAAVILTLIFIVMFAEPVFLQFTTSPIVGTISGMLYRRSGQREFSR